MQEEKKEKRSSLAQKVSSFFNRHEILLVPVVYLVVFLMGTGICTISNGIAYLIGEPDTMYIIAIAIVFAVIIAGVVYEHRSGSKMKDSNISDGTEWKLCLVFVYIVGIFECKRWKAPYNINMQININWKIILKNVNLHSYRMYVILTLWKIIMK